MYAMFQEMDGIETPLAKDHKIYRIDTTDAFPIDLFRLDYAGINIEVKGINPHAILKEILLSKDHSDALSQDICDCCLQHRLEEDKTCTPYFLEPFSRIQEIRSDYIDDFLNTLCYFYPDFIGEYFKRYLTALQAQCADYLKEKRSLQG